MVKQNIIKKLLDDNNYIYTYYDEIIDVKCGKERPDFVFDCNTHYIVLEVDEDQHRGRLCSCEQVRMVNISQTLMGTPVIFIRYNPDMFKVDGLSIQISDNDRHIKLLEYIDELWNTDVTTLGFLNVAYLFFDEYDENDIKITQIIKWNKDKIIDNSIDLKSIKKQTVQIFKSDMFKLELERYDNTLLENVIDTINKSYPEHQNYITSKKLSNCSYIDILLNLEKEDVIRNIITRVKIVLEHKKRLDKYLTECNSENYKQTYIYNIIKDYQLKDYKYMGYILKIKLKYEELIKPIYNKIIGRLRAEELLQIFVIEYSCDDVIAAATQLQKYNSEIHDSEIKWSGPVYDKLKTINKEDIKVLVKKSGALKYYNMSNYNNVLWYNLPLKKLIDVLMRYNKVHKISLTSLEPEKMNILNIDLDKPKKLTVVQLKKLCTQYDIKENIYIYCDKDKTKDSIYHVIENENKKKIYNTRKSLRYNGKQYARLKKAELIQLLKIYIDKTYDNMTDNETDEKYYL